MTANAVGFSEIGPVVALNGLVAKNRNVSHVSDVFDERGLKRAENFVYLEPFFLPRDQALAQLPKSESDTPKWLFGIAAALSLIVAFKWRRRGAKQASPAPEQSKPAPSFGPGFANSGFAQQRQTPTAAEIKALAAAHSATAKPQSPALAQNLARKGPSRVSTCCTCCLPATHPRHRLLQAASQKGTVRIIIDAGPPGVADRIVGLLRALPVPLSINLMSA